MSKEYAKTPWRRVGTHIEDAEGNFVASCYTSLYPDLRHLIDGNLDLIIASVNGSPLLQWPDSLRVENDGLREELARARAHAEAEESDDPRFREAVGAVL